MKKVVLMVVASMITSVSFAQKIQNKVVPTSVKTAFKKLYPNAQEVKWSKEEGNFEVDFDLKKIDYSVLFDTSGQVIETEVEIEIKQLPKGVAEYVKNNYKKVIKEAAKITDGKGVITYEAEIKEMDLLFDSNGKFIKEVKD